MIHVASLRKIIGNKAPPSERRSAPIAQKIQNTLHVYDSSSSLDKGIW